MGDMLSQAEIDALLSGVTMDSDSSDNSNNSGSADSIDINLSEEETDALGEIGNISMGNSATTLSSLLDQKVSITTPVVSVMTWKELIEKNTKPYVVVKVTYTEGLIGTNLLVLNAKDVKIITNLMMGGQAPESGEDEVTELELSAICEAMNQMIGTSSTSMSSMIGKKIDISPPTAQYFNLETDIGDVYHELPEDEIVVKIAFRMTIGDLIDSEIMQIIPLEFGRSLVEGLLNPSAQQTPPPPPVRETPVQQQVAAAAAPPPPPVVEQPNYNYQPQPQMDNIPPSSFNYRVPEPPRTPVNVQPVQFQSLEDMGFSGNRENIGLIMDVPLQVTVELGRTTKLIRDILEFGTGSIVELDKLAGEPVDVLVNGKIIAKGEVVVIDENFGVRITDIVHPSKRL